jgi:hypothetical protein
MTDRKLIVFGQLGLFLVFLVFAVSGYQKQGVTHVRAQAKPIPEASPSPVDQHFKIESGPIESFEETLHRLNSEGRIVTSEQWFVSQDGKRFTIVLSDPDDSDDREDGH